MHNSVIRIYGENKSTCGYCKNSSADSSISYGIVSERMRIEDYERLMLAGWRRSGDYFYKPVMHKTCCPQYTIRLNVSNFVESKKHKQVIRKVQRFLASKGSNITEDSKHNTTLNSDAELQINKEIDSTSKSLLTIETALPKCTLEVLELYKKYQVSVHNDKPEEVTEGGFTRFLISSPLFDDCESRQDMKLSSDPFISMENEESTTEGQSSHHAFPYKYGTYHQLYRLNGKLIAVGVIDIIPSGLSSVYLFYDPDERHLALGKFTALKEIEFCKRNNFEYYYMGFYIHSCEKMKYKGEYSPSELLCPTSLQFFPLKESIPYLSKLKFTPLEPTLAEERLRENISVEIESSSTSTDKEPTSTDNIVAATSLVSEEPTDTILSKYAPRFPGLSDFNFNRVKISLGDDDNLLSLQDLNSRGQLLVETYFIELFENCGAESISNFTVKFN